MLAVSQLAWRICVLGTCEQKLCEPARIMPLAAKRKGTWSPITGSKQYKIILNNSWFLDLIKMKGWIGTATSEFSVRGRSLQQSLGEKLWNCSSYVGRQSSKNIWPCSLCWTCSCSCFLLLVPKWQWHIHLNHGGKIRFLKQLIMNHTKNNPTTQYWGHKKNVVQHLQSWEKKEVRRSNAPKVACKVTMY